jgi:hypothetical protein
MHKGVRSRRKYLREILASLRKPAKRLRSKCSVSEFDSRVGYCATMFHMFRRYPRPYPWR